MRENAAWLGVMLMVLSELFLNGKDMPTPALGMALGAYSGATRQVATIPRQ
jgi:hypothetical protein